MGGGGRYLTRRGEGQSQRSAEVGGGGEVCPTHLRAAAAPRIRSMEERGVGPPLVQFDNARVPGWGPAARYLSRVMPSCSRFAVELIFIPLARPQRNGSVEHFNGWFQSCLLQRGFARAYALRRALQPLQDTVNQHQMQRRCQSAFIGQVSTVGSHLSKPASIIILMPRQNNGMIS